MAKETKYFDLKGRSWNLSALDADERRVVGELRRHADAHPDWNEFDNTWTHAVLQLYRGRGLTNKEIPPTAVYQIAQDLSSRIALRAGLAKLSTS